MLKLRFTDSEDILEKVEEHLAAKDSDIFFQKTEQQSDVGLRFQSWQNTGLHINYITLSRYLIP